MMASERGARPPVRTVRAVRPQSTNLSIYVFWGRSAYCRDPYAPIYTYYIFIRKSPVRPDHPTRGPFNKAAAEPELQLGSRTARDKTLPQRRGGTVAMELRLSKGRDSSRMYCVSGAILDMDDDAVIAASQTPDDVDQGTAAAPSHSEGKGV